MGNCPSDSDFLSCAISYKYLNIPLILNKDFSLPSLNADNDSVTMSGFSSGAFATATMHVIYSDRIKGAGIICGG